MDKIIMWALILGAIYGFILLVFNTIADGIKFIDYIKSRRHKDGR
ncbi:hypothetical protein [Caproicibacter fermentans]|nr:hypothetical protein [Caproicibacter fermentans]